MAVSHFIEVREILSLVRLNFLLSGLLPVANLHLFGSLKLQTIPRLALTPNSLRHRPRSLRLSEGNDQDTHPSFLKLRASGRSAIRIASQPPAARRPKKE